MLDNLTSRAWKDPSARRSMSASQLDKLPGHPAGAGKLDQEMINSKPEAVTAQGSPICSPCPPRHCY